MHASFFTGISPGFRRKALRGLFASIQAFLFSIDNSYALGIFTASAVALFAHKTAVILLHRPLPTITLIICAPFLFTFDFITLLLLHRGLRSPKQAWQILAGSVCLVIVSCSSSFVSLYLESNTELNWGRTVEVHHFERES
jgi:hypothetical protein